MISEHPIRGHYEKPVVAVNTGAHSLDADDNTEDEWLLEQRTLRWPTVVVHYGMRSVDLRRYGCLARWLVTAYRGALLMSDWSNKRTLRRPTIAVHIGMRSVDEPVVAVHKGARSVDWPWYWWWHQWWVITHTEDTPNDDMAFLARWSSGWGL